MLGHLPRSCPNYGWYFPAPGKSREDYAEDRQRVQDLIAGDIIAEHTVDEADDEVIVFQGARPTAQQKAEALQRKCPRCHEEAGNRCKTSAGDFTEVHKARLDAIDSPGTGS